jgi:hypothetical protein
MKSPAVKQLDQQAFEALRAKYPQTPLAYIPKPKYSDATANGLQKCIIDFLRFNNWQCERIAVTGRYIDNSKVVTDCLGNKRKIGTGKYIPSSMQKGSSDLSATIAGRSVKIEIKIGNDKQSDYQKQYEAEVIRAGGQYWIVRTFEGFIQMYNDLIKENSPSMEA